jgi:hypothetical protein
MATARSKADPIDTAAEEAVRILNVARLFETARTADKIFVQIARCNDFVETEKPTEPDATFTRMALELSRSLIQFATDLNALSNARGWLTANGLLEAGDDALDVLAKLTLVHTINRAAQRYPKETRWARMKKRIEKAKPVRHAA